MGVVEDNKKIVGLIEDLVSHFLYYDRKEDENLKVGDIETAYAAGVVSIEEMVDKFKQELEKVLKDDVRNCSD